MPVNVDYLGLSRPRSSTKLHWMNILGKVKIVPDMF